MCPDIFLTVVEALVQVLLDDQSGLVGDGHHAELVFEALEPEALKPEALEPAELS
jgi:hypothetical protein